MAFPMCRMTDGYEATNDFKRMKNDKYRIVQMYEYFYINSIDKSGFSCYNIYENIRVG